MHAAEWAFGADGVLLGLTGAAADGAPGSFRRLAAAARRRNGVRGRRLLQPARHSSLLY
eukprot:COSAG05_NODE_2203_length_3404_cov_4.906203_1_plen_59_part_00